MWNEFVFGENPDRRKRNSLRDSRDIIDERCRRTKKKTMLKKLFHKTQKRGMLITDRDGWLLGRGSKQRSEQKVFVSLQDKPDCRWPQLHKRQTLSGIKQSLIDWDTLIWNTELGHSDTKELEIKEYGFYPIYTCFNKHKRPHSFEIATAGLTCSSLTSSSL